MERVCLNPEPLEAVLLDDELELEELDELEELEDDDVGLLDEELEIVVELLVVVEVLCVLDELEELVFPCVDRE